jgi:hypothetical protein
VTYLVPFAVCNIGILIATLRRSLRALPCPTRARTCFPGHSRHQRHQGRQNERLDLCLPFVRACVAMAARWKLNVITPIRVRLHADLELHQSPTSAFCMLTILRAWGVRRLNRNMAMAPGRCRPAQT